MLASDTLTANKKQQPIHHIACKGMLGVCSQVFSSDLFGPDRTLT
jgi:hypothetical protein